MIDYNFLKDKYRIISFFQKEKPTYDIINEFINFSNNIYENKILFNIDLEFNIASGKIDEKIHYKSNLSLFTRTLPKLYFSSVENCIDKYNRFKKLKGFL